MTFADTTYTGSLLKLAIVGGNHSPTERNSGSSTFENPEQVARMD
jgi:hypothetical protein